MTDDARLGRAILTGDYLLTVGELAGLLVAAAATPLDLADPDDDLARLVARLWADLRAVDATVAGHARTIAAETGHPRTVVALAQMFSNTQPTTTRSTTP